MTQVTFKPKIFATIFLCAHLVVYLCYSFVELSFVKPIIYTLETNNSRSGYIAFVFMVTFFALIFSTPIEKK